MSIEMLGIKLFTMVNLRFILDIQNPKNMKQKYDSSIVYLYANGKENVLPKEFRQQIPYTTIASWRKTDYSSYIGNEFRYFFDEAIESAQAKLKYKRMKDL